MELVMVTVERALVAVPYFAVLVALLVLGKQIFNWTTKYQFNSELTDRDNAAFGVTLAGFLIGLVVALGATTFGAELSVNDFASIGIYGALALVLMRLSVVINDKLILHRFSIHDEITRDQNAGTGFVVAGSCIATGFVISGALTGESLSFVSGVTDVLIYWAIGQALLVIGGILFQAITSYDAHKIIGEDDNVAAGVSFGGFLVGIGIITKAALTGATSNILAEIPVIAILTICGLALLVATRVIVDRLFLPSSALSKEVAVDGNIAAGAVAAASFVSLSWAYAAAVTI
jgi:uncharacterized membrane protein YjfL (UPF0719 family)